MNVLPKKRAQQLAQYLTLSRNLSLPRNITVLQKLPIWGKWITSRSMNLMRLLATKTSSKQIQLEKLIPHRSVGALRLDDFSKTLSTKMISRRFVWFSASLAMYGWFLFQIANDIFILHKAVTQVSMTNYAGAISAIALIWCGTIVLKAQPATVLRLIGKILEAFREKKQASTGRTTSTTIHMEHFSEAQIIPVTVMPSELPVVRKKRPKKSPAGSKCQNHITSKLNIPDSCLICKELIVCRSKLD